MNRSAARKTYYFLCCLVLCIVLLGNYGIRGYNVPRTKRVLPNDPVGFSQLRDYISTKKTLPSKVDPANPNTNYIFRGPGSEGVCVPTLLFGSFTKNMWCEIVNPYAGTPDIFFDTTILPTGEFSYECEESGPYNHSLPHDDQMDNCKSIVGIRGFDENFLLYDMSYVVEAFANGRVFLMRNTIEHMFEKATRIYYEPDLFKNIIKFDGHAKETGFGSDGYDHLTFAQNAIQNNQLYVNGIYNITLNFIDGSLKGKNWYYPLDESVTDVLQLRMTRESQSQNIYSVALAKISSTKYQIYFIQPEAVSLNEFKVTKWTITVPEGNKNINFDIAHQHGKFSPSAPMRIDPIFFFNKKLSTSRVLINIQTDKEVRIFEFSGKDVSQKEIDFTTKDVLNTFYVAPEYTEITYSHLVSEMIRRPSTITRQTTCDNVQFPVSQNMFLLLGLKQTYDGPSNPIYRLTIHHIEEFYSYNFEKDFSNTANRPKNFACSPSQFINAQGQCEDNVENYEVFDSEIISINSRFMDVNHTTGSVPSYLEGGYLNPEVFCEMEFIGAGRPPHREECRVAAKNVTCEIEIFNGGMGDMRNLYSFFYGYWQQNIYVAKASAAMEIHAMALDIDLVKPQAYVSLKKLNRFKTLGNIVDVFVSTNNQHLFVAVSRQKWELEAKKRYSLVCKSLLTNPDNVFLKMFDDECTLVPPTPIDENQFAISSSSCIRGNVCGFFSKNQIRPSASKGTFVYRSLAEIPCILGSYCVAGIRIPCPLGYVCPDFAMVAPKKCDADYGYQSCYSQNLITAYECPNGTLCTTDYLIPIPASPGHFVKKTVQEDGSLIINGLTLCEEGDYCNLAREIILTPENSTLKALLCPADTYCTNSSILEPSLCSFTNSSMDYCPPGTVEKDLCPAGFYCENPNSIKECDLTQYCPEGSFTYSLCPEGYYCPNASLKVVCPEGYFCRQGFIEPSQCSWFLSSCPEGSPTDRMTYGGVLLVFCLLILLACLYFAYGAAFKFYVKMSARQREENPHEASSLFSRAQKQQNYGSSFHEEQFTVDIGFQDLGLVLRGSGKKVLDGVTGEIKHGKLTAVMGLSGAGKSTFITTLSNRAYYGAQIGKVFVNGVEEPLSKYNRKIGFVPQDDIMISSMTVEETLYFSAKTRLDANTPAKQIDSIVNDVIKVLRLEDVRHSIIGDQEKRGISGGQKKRVNVGIELVSSPYVLFLDEPTSGLDSASSKEVCEALQAISSCGITVITVIHQPRYEIFNMFDNLLLLGKGGRTIYLGEVQRVEDYFREIGFTKPPGTNLADFAIDVSAGLMERDDGEEFHPSDLPAIWDKLKVKYTDDQSGIAKHLPSIEYASPSSFEGTIQSTEVKPVKIETPPTRVNKFRNPRLPYFSQFWMCFKRSCTQLLRTLPSLVLDYALVFLCGAFLGLIYYNKVYIGPPPKSVYEMCPNGLEEICAQPLEDPIYATSSLMTLAMALMGAMSALRVFGNEYLVFYRESQTGLSTFCYFWAKDISMFIVNIFAPMVFLGIYYTTVAPRAPVYEYYYVLLLVYWTSYGLGYFISIIIQPNISQLTAVVVVFIFNTFSGATTPLPTFKSMYFPINILPYLSYLTYSHENAYLIELKRYENIYDLSKSLKLMGYKWDEFSMSIYMMVVFGFIFRLASFISLVCVKPSSFYNLAVIATHNFFSTQVRKIFSLCRRSSSNV